MDNLVNNNAQQKEFAHFIRAIDSEIEHAQIKLISAANVQLLLHYWKIGYFILFNQQRLGWGGKVIEKISKAIRDKYPEKKGYSPRNLKYMCQFAKLYPLKILEKMLWANEELENPTAIKVLDVAKTLNKSEIGQQAVAQLQIADSEKNTFGQEPLAQLQMVDSEVSIFGQQAVAQIQDVPLTLIQITQEPLAQIENNFLSSPVAKINWASHIILMNSNLPLGVRYWYMKEALEYGWSRNILDLQIKTGLFQRQIEKQKVNNFTATLPKPQSDLANYLLKDPYIFDLAGAKEAADERDIEKQLVGHVTKYLLEMGTGFAFVARQKHFQIGSKDFYADLILYNISLHAYVVVELKATPFKPEYAGQLNFYINVVNDKLRGEHDNKTIGLLLCRGKDEIMAQYALEGYNQPIGVSDYRLSKAIPKELKSVLPSIEEVEQELSQLLEQKKADAP
ncbi:MAG: PDDEXK nuclease domain-containing protein [Prevotellaceae bacterium]|jgi:predicted nuclease of restriction endonuclease-like (RecB) superfamily|nr:PDDEXK nuclease domain-containing protein [Prevotellaceae bacterium]